jgi:4-nitrophenyl phosphatase
MLETIAGVVLDMDGVLWRGDEALPGLTALFDHLNAHRIPFALATNNSMRSPADYVGKLAQLGVSKIDREQIITSGVAAVEYLKAAYPKDTPVHVLGGDGLKGLVVAAGFPLHYLDRTPAKVVLVGLDMRVTYDKLKRAALLIRGGADFIGTNNDATFPTPEGLAPGAGSLLALLRTATGREPLLMGKPSAAMFAAALKIVGTPPDKTLMIGDRLDTDIAGAARAGLKTALVLTGVSSREDAERAEVKPDAVYADLPALLAAWTRSQSL